MMLTHDHAPVAEPSPSDFRRLARTCPRCQSREPTLGPTCPLCGASYEPQAWTDRVSEFGSDWPMIGSLGVITGGAVAALLTLLSFIGQALLAPGRSCWNHVRRRLR
jgi:hypothetical protein